jgi:hypothetical protein
VKVALRSREIFSYGYAESENPPILHRKETFVHSDYPQYGKFARLTEQEVKHGLLDDGSTIGTREGWNRCLFARRIQIRGHRLVRKKESEP